jgi:type I restriction-modification system DNA methylase subunit/restriction endonuclease S subunit
MPQNYKCGICDSTPDQLSHHKSHIGTQKHQDKRQVFELKLKMMTSENLQEKYGTNNIQEIVERYETQKVIIVSKNSSPEIKKTISGNTIWNLETSQDTNQNYASIKAKLDSVVKRCHDLLYGQGGSIVGNKAQNDIMRLLCLKILQSQFNDENSELWERCNQVKSNENMSDAQFARFKSYCNDITEITKKDDVFKEWRIFVNKFLSKVFPSIYYENDNKFNCDKSQCIIELIKIIDSLDINEEFKDAFSTTCGDIHESFRAYGGRNSGAKALGQYFTPRHLIHLMFHGIGLDSLIRHMDNITIYDPCMGTGGFLTRLFKMVSIPSENIYGCETEIDTIKFGEMSMVLTTGDYREDNIIKCDSLCENKFILDKKFSAIVTNPPFGTKMSYKDLKSTFESKFPEAPVKFEEIYPLKTNNGACLFVQHCVYMLAEGGFCAIVLPDGELFEGNSKWSKTFRKWLSEQVNIRTILKVASGTFEHAGVKTNVVVFTKDGPTQNIHFMETPKECNTVKDMFTISAGELKSAGYSLDVGEYLVEETDNYDVPMISLGEVITKQNNFQDINADIDYKIVKMSKLVAPEIREIKKGCNIKSTKLQLVEENTFIMSKILNYCYGIYNNNIQNGYLSSEYWIFKIRDNTLFNYFMLIYKNIIVHKLKSIAHGVGVPRINYQDFMSKIKIPLPSLEVQQQIVDELSQIETSIETIESRIAQLKREKDQYKKYGRKAEIRERLKDSEEKMLGEVCELNEKGNTNTKSITNTGEYPFYSASVKNPVGTHNSYCFDGSEYILFIKSGGNGKNPISYSHGIGKVYYVTGKTSGNTEVVKISVKGNVSLKYIYNYLKSKQLVIQKFAKYSANGNLGHTNMTKLNEFKIPIPSQEVQQQCITLFEEKEKFIQSIDDKINSEKAYIEELKQMAKDVISSFC